MGRIKTTLVKRTAENFLEKFSGNFESDFNKNKKALAKISEISSKKLRNKIAGYLTRLSREKKS